MTIWLSFAAGAAVCFLGLLCLGALRRRRGRPGPNSIEHVGERIIAVKNPKGHRHAA